MRLKFLARSCSHEDHRRHNCPWTLRFEKGASLTGVAFYHWLADEFRRPRGLDDDGIGIATALLRSYTEQHGVSIHESSFFSSLWVRDYLFAGKFGRPAKGNDKDQASYCTSLGFLNAS